MAMTEDALRASIKEKKAELAALEQLRDQSSALVAHLEAMKGKFGEIKEGTAGEAMRRAHRGRVARRGRGYWLESGGKHAVATFAASVAPPCCFPPSPQWRQMCLPDGASSLLSWRPGTRTG